MQAIVAADRPDDPLASITIPPGGGGPFLEAALPRAAAQLGALLIDKPVALGARVIAVRHRDVVEVLRRDLDFRIGPVNATRIEEVNGPFILGMDRCQSLTEERHALYATMAEIDFTALTRAASDHADALLAQSPKGLDAVGGYARLVAGGTAVRLFGVCGPDEPTYLEVVRAIFCHTFLNLNGDEVVRRRALRAAALMRDLLTAEISRRRSSKDLGDDLMGVLLRRAELDDEGVRRTLGGMVVGAIDTTASATAKILAMLGRDRILAARVVRDVDDPSLLLGWCRDILRLWPHNPIVLRQAAGETVLRGVKVAAGAQVIAWTQAAMFDAEAFPDPHQVRPDRPAEAYLHFGGGLHPCAGRALNDLQLPLLVGKLVRRGLIKVGPVEWAGPFPTKLPIVFGDAR